MNEIDKKLLVEKFRNGKCSENELEQLRKVSEWDKAIRRMLDLGEVAFGNSGLMMSDEEVVQRVKELNAESRRSGKRDEMR